MRAIDKKPICNGNTESFRAMLGRDSIIGWHFRSFGRKRGRMRAWAAAAEGPAVLLFTRSRDLEVWIDTLGDRSANGTTAPGGAETVRRLVDGPLDRPERTPTAADPVDVETFGPAPLCLDVLRLFVRALCASATRLQGTTADDRAGVGQAVVKIRTSRYALIQLFATLGLFIVLGVFTPMGGDNPLDQALRLSSFGTRGWFAAALNCVGRLTSALIDQSLRTFVDFMLATSPSPHEQRV